ncbi:MAG: phosphoribosylformylglycinamidine synthase, partial [Coriobacteriales bacterium]
MVSRVYVEKKPGFDVEAKQLLAELRTILQIEALTGVRLVNRYDVEGISDELFQQCVPTVFSEPQSDDVSFELPDAKGAAVFAVEYLPGQFDQRADSASECVQLISCGERPDVRSAKVYYLEGELSAQDVAAIKGYVINPIEAREASLDTVETLKTAYPEPQPVEILDGFLELDAAGLQAFIDERGLAMDLADITFFQQYFRDEEKRCPTITEVKMVDTYWSDHCRHTTFGTVLEEVTIDDPTVQAAFDRYMDMRHELGRDAKPVCLMDLGTIGAKYLKAKGILKNLDESEEINACTVKVKVDVDGVEEDWLYLFKNETHNHPTEVEPFGGAATCVGGAIRDPLSGRSYVYQAMRVTGAANPLAPVSETIPGKLPQRKLVTTAAAGYSSYGNQIGLATGQVSELYHPGYAAKRMEIGAVVAATPAWHVRRETPAPGDAIILLGGRTGRDGIGGATGSSKAHTASSIETCGAEVQKGNAPVERKLQRLFRRGDACKLIKRCNDFGAGGVSVATGEIADGLLIDLNTVPKKYEGLDGTELAIAESQERMACAVAPEDVEEFLGYAREENLEATVIATVTEDPRLVMTWNGDQIVNVSRAFLNSNGAPKSAKVHICEGTAYTTPWEGESLEERMTKLVTDLNVASNKGLSERFDSTIGAATVLMPFGGKNQLTPAMAMAAKMPVDGETTTCSGMAWGFNPYLSEADQYTGAYLAVVESVCRLVAAGFQMENTYLTFQEYFGKLKDVPERWGKPAGSLLGALMAQVDLGVGSIGGKDSMSGSFEDLDVPPTLVSFATAVGSIERVTSPEFKKVGSPIVCIQPAYPAQGLIPTAQGMNDALALVEELIGSGAALSVSACGYGSDAEAIFKMCVGNGIGAKLDGITSADQLFQPAYGSFVVELGEDIEIDGGEFVSVTRIGTTTAAYVLEACGETISLAQLQEAWEAKMEPVFPYRGKGEEVEAITDESHVPLTFSTTLAKPRVIIPVFPGNNCEFDSARAFRRAGAQAETLVINNLTPNAVAESVEALVKAINNSQIVMIPGGFSGGDEPDGSAKFI